MTSAGSGEHGHFLWDFSCLLPVLLHVLKLQSVIALVVQNSTKPRDLWRFVGMIFAIETAANGDLEYSVYTINFSVAVSLLEMTK